MTVESNAIKQGARLLSTVVESEKVSRFFYKLLVEADEIGATALIFECNEPTLSVTLKNGDGTVVKNIEIRALWYEKIKKWCKERGALSISPQSSGDNELGTVLLPRGETLVKGVMELSLSKEGEKFVLRNLSVLTRESVLSQLEVSSILSEHLTTFAKTESAVFLFCGATQENLSTSQGLILSLLNATLGGTIEDLSTVEPAPSGARVVYCMRSSDPVDALLALRGKGVSPREIGLCGIICGALVKRVCKGCGREAVIDQRLLDLLPLPLKSRSLGTYQVGRGCDQCGHSGVKGTILLASLLSINEEILSKLESGVSDRALVECAYAGGLRSLFEDGVEKAFRGKLTLESLFEVVKTLPPAYEKVLEENSKIAEKSRIERQLQSATDGDAPLFPAISQKVSSGPARVLIVEDDMDQREILEMCLKSVNLVVDSASDGVDALTKIESEIPDLIITDLSMPNMDGTQLLTHLKDSPHYSQIPVLVLTVMSDADKEYSLLSLGADDYCEKTIQRKILLKRVENLLRRSGVSSE